MFENELNKRLKNRKKYIGSYAADELKDVELKYQPSFLVINMGKRDSAGSHWIALAVYENDLFICDSLGGIKPDTETPTDLINFLYLISKHRTLYITKQLQPLTSEKCGEYCILFVNEMSRHNSFSKFVALFTLDKEQNDKIVLFLT